MCLSPIFRPGEGNLKGGGDDVSDWRGEDGDGDGDGVVGQDDGRSDGRLGGRHRSFGRVQQWIMFIELSRAVGKSKRQHMIGTGQTRGL